MMSLFKPEQNKNINPKKENGHLYPKLLSANDPIKFCLKSAKAIKKNILN